MKELLKEIESVEFSISLNVVSGIKSFITVCKHHGAWISLAQSIENDQSTIKAVSGRILELCSKDFDKRYENPNDTALAAYLLSIKHAGGKYMTQVYGLAKYCAKTENTFWSKKIAVKIVQEHEILVGAIGNLFATSSGQAVETKVDYSITRSTQPNPTIQTVVAA